jgi:diguanylate cyclase (GGDEF)-like protein
MQQAGCRTAERDGGVDQNGIQTDFGVDWWHRVSVRIGISVVVVTAATLGAIGWLIDTNEEELFRQQHTANAHAIARVIVDKLADRMMAGGGATTWASVAEEAARFVETAGVGRIHVVSVGGQIKVATDTTEQNHAHALSSARVGGEDAQETVGGDGSRWLRVVHPIKPRPGCLACHGAADAAQGQKVRGYVVVDFDLSPLENTSEHRRNEIVTVGVFSGAALLVLIFWLFERSVMRPIAVIVAAAARLARGDLRARAGVRAPDELGRLAQQFNNMAGRIENQVARLEASNLESALLYELVVEVSRSIEVTEVAATIVKVLAQNLQPTHIAFFGTTPEGHWTCARGTEERATLCEGDLADAIGQWMDPVAQILEGFDRELVTSACRDGELKVKGVPGVREFAVPLIAERRLIGLLACRLDPARFRIQRELLGNLAAHLTLALENALHYTGAVTDMLTRLRNKGYGLARLEEAVYSAARQKQSLALAMLDIDLFKRINDSRGHPVGDLVLREVGSRIQHNIRKADVPVRFGGEEFMVILPQTLPEKLFEIGERLRLAIADVPVVIDQSGTAIPVTVSVGLAVFVPGKDTAASLLERADQALYRAKRGGRNRVELDGGEADAGSESSATAR